MKKNIEKFAAKAIWYILLACAIGMVILLISAIGVMVEAMAITALPASIAFICVAWLVAFAAFIKLLDR